MEASQQPPAPPATPTPADAQAIFDKADAAARRAEDAASRIEAARTAASEESRERFPGMPEEVVKQISEGAAAAVVQALNAQYEVNPPTTPTPGAAPSSTSGDAGASEGSGQAGGGSEPAKPEGPRPSLADRILGTGYAKR